MRQSDRPADPRGMRRPLIKTVLQLLPAALLFGVLPSARSDQTAGLPDDTGPSEVIVPSQSGSSAEPAYRTQWVRGKVVWLADALQDQFGISTVPEVAENSLALLSSDGKLIPIVENVRGRAFRKDPRLREMEVEILARRHEQHPMIQILRLHQVDGEQRYEVDYWCDICAIVMYETGPCSCCQDDNRLRKRPVEPQDLLPDAADSVPQ